MQVELIKLYQLSEVKEVVMAIKSYFWDAVAGPDGSVDRQYSADDFVAYLAKIVGDGVFNDPSTSLQVLASSGLTVIVKTGEAWIKGRKMRNTTDLSLTLDAADVLYNRIDRIIFGYSTDDRDFFIEVLKGTPALSPVAPTLTRTGSRMEFALADILVSAQATAITQEDITDVRADSSVCGWVAGLVQTVNTESLFLQWQTAYNAQYAEFLAQTRDFMQTLTEDLRVNTYLTKYQKAVNLTSGDSLTIPLNMSGYTYEPTDIIEVYINGLMGTPGVDYTLNNAVTPATVTLNLTLHSGITENIYIRVLKTKIGIIQIVDNQGNIIVDQYGNPIIAGD